MDTALSRDRGWSASVRRQTVKLGCWTLAWLVTMAIANVGPTFFRASNECLTVTALDISNVISFDAEIEHPVIRMSLTCLATLVTLTRTMR